MEVAVNRALSHNSSSFLSNLIFFFVNKLSSSSCRKLLPFSILGYSSSSSNPIAPLVSIDCSLLLRNKCSGAVKYSHLQEATLEEHRIVTMNGCFANSYAHALSHLSDRRLPGSSIVGHVGHSAFLSVHIPYVAGFCFGSLALASHSGSRSASTLCQTAKGRSSRHAPLRPSPPPASVPLFDICPDKGKVSIPCPKTRAQPLSKKGPAKLITPEDDRLRSTKELRPGLVILKNYINHKDQVNIVKKCRELGLGPGGFYQPGYASGGKMNLQMMCLGKNWDPQTLYDDIRRYDGAKPPNVPDDFKMLVEKAIQDARDYLKTNIPGSVERRLPMMSPDICLVNFYSETGTLGFHQDKDETPESLKKGLPVVSFSFGDTCVFAYGDSWDACGEKVYLRSGDVLIFGGRSRMIYHGVRNILPRTAPPLLLEETGLRPGRLNLTFRQY